MRFDRCPTWRIADAGIANIDGGGWTLSDLAIRKLKRSFSRPALAAGKGMSGSMPSNVLRFSIDGAELESRIPQ